MRASILTEFGCPDVLQVREVARPTPLDREVLVRVHATSVGFGDTLVRNLAASTPRTFHMPLLFWLYAKLAFGVRTPKIRILGSEFAGEVETVGEAVTRFQKGDPVFGYCGPRMGGYAEYLRVPEDGVLAVKPACLTWAQAAAIPYAAVMAFGVLRKARLRRGERVLVVGASGGIGPAILRLAKVHFGASVAAVCGTARLDYVTSLGADVVIDYTREDFVDRPDTYDVIIDVLGKRSFFRCCHVLRPRGRMVFVSFKMRQILEALWTAIHGDRRAVCALVTERQEDLFAATELMEAGELTPVVDRIYPLEQAADAHRYAESGAKTGYVVLAVSPPVVALSGSPSECGGR